jgi:NADH-quinone oxidoreductase subunit J
MNVLFYISAGVAVICTIMVITNLNSVHALLYLIVSLLSLALIFFLLGAPFAAALEIIVYAGAIMVLFVFVVMMLNPESQTIQSRKQLLRSGMWFGPAVPAAILLGELIYVLTVGSVTFPATAGVGPHALSRTLFGPYALGVELASILLMAGLVGAYHLARPEARGTPEGDDR